MRRYQTYFEKIGQRGSLDDSPGTPSTSVMVTCSVQNELILDISECVGHQCMLVITPWDKGFQWSWIGGKGVREKCTWQDGSFLPLSLLVNDIRTKAWVDSMPCQLLSPLMEFDKLYPGLIFRAMWFLSRYTRAVDLLLSYPILIALILYRAEIENWNEQTVVELFSVKRTHILAACGLHGTKGNLKILKKLHFSRFGLKEFRTLLLSQKTTEYLQLGRLCYLDFNILKFMIRPRSFPLLPFFNDYGPMWSWIRFKEQCADLIRMGKILDLQNIHDLIFSCQNLKALSRLHDNLVIQINKKEIDSLPLICYPPPPIMGTESIIPITDNKQLRIEGATQHHCVAIYHPEIKRNRYYVYKITEPERATLGIRIRPGNIVEIDQLKLCYNTAPSEQTKSMVNEWIIAAKRESPVSSVHRVENDLVTENASDVYDPDDIDDEELEIWQEILTENVAHAADYYPRDLRIR